MDYLRRRVRKFGCPIYYAKMFAHGRDVYIGIYPDKEKPNKYERVYGQFCLKDLLSASNLIADLIEAEEKIRKLGLDESR